MKEYNYKGFIIIKNGTKEMPYNIYKIKEVKIFGEIRNSREWLGYDKTIKACKSAIDDKCFD